MKTRIYEVVVKPSKQEILLVDAASKNAAIRHVAARIVEANCANGKMVADLMRQGVEVETAHDPDQLKLFSTAPEEGTINVIRTEPANA